MGHGIVGIPGALGRCRWRSRRISARRGFVWNVLLERRSRPRSSRAGAPRGPPLRTVGHERMSPHLRNLLRDARLLTLVDAEGIGKTRLAAVSPERFKPTTKTGVEAARLRRLGPG